MPSSSSPNSSSNNLQQLAQANEEFCFRLLHQLESDDKSNGGPGNLFISPVSITTVLAMLMAGGRGQTLEELKKSIGNCTTLLQKAPHFGWGNAVALQGAVNPAYLDLVKSTFDAAIFSLDFSAASSTALNELNSWMLDSLERNTKIVLLNAIYFKGSWKLPFPPKSTAPKEFNCGKGQKVTVPMMHLKDVRLRYAEFDDGQLVELPYQSGDQERDATANIQLCMPSGIQASFNPLLADFGRMEVVATAGGGQPSLHSLYLSSVFHRSVVEVNEEGSEAAAATVAIVCLRAMPMPKRPVTVILNRPFLFLIRDRLSQVTFFAGVLSKP
ncbi:hypothetical protein TYRP_015973 [Tyrophagus putrescentiae]|nr:hypothetical protein TYRP_015973 [Tyrophagus putrescentiae]